MRSLEFSNGDRLPGIGLGTWKAAPGEVYQAVTEALKIGYRHIDCAAIYGNEAEVGKALADSFAAGVVARQEVWVTSKLWNNAHAPEDVQPALEKTLSDLRLDYLDLYLVHWPIAYKPQVQYHTSADDFIPIEQLPIAVTWAKLEEMARLGLCRHLGVSNFSTAKLETLLTGSRIRPEMNQIELHPYLQQPGMLKFCRDRGIHLTAYAPLGSSDRPGRLRSADDPVLLDDPAIAAIAARHQASPAQVLISWALHRNTAAIPKSVRPERLRQNLAAADVSLSRDDLDKISALDRRRRYITGAFWEVEGGPYTIATIWDE